MDNNKTTLKWSEMYKLKVVVPSEGTILGQIEDFLVKEGTNAVHSLLVHTRLHGDLTLPITGITAVEADHVAILSAQWLAKGRPAYLYGQSLLSRKVVNESGKDLGTVKDVVLSVAPIVSMRITAFEVTHGSAGHDHWGFTSDGIVRYGDGTVIVDDKLVKKVK